jgi:hypothetical protein
MELLDHRRKAKLVIHRDCFSVDHVSARKAGGTGLAISTAAMEWFVLQGRPQDVWLLDDNGVLTAWFGDNVSGENPDPSAVSHYSDITRQVESQLLEAERLASPEDFPCQEQAYDMGVPVGFIERLHRIWLRKRFATPAA